MNKIDGARRNAREHPGAWFHAADTRPSHLTRERLTRDGYQLRYYHSAWWVMYAGLAVDVDVNPGLL